MAITDFSQNDSDQNQISVLDGSQDTLRIENSEFISNSDLSRDGFDLVLTLENGDTLIIEEYFSSDTPPTLISETGSALTPQLVDSFVQGNQFAQATTGTDVSPVGAVKELSGDATVTRTNGTVETITLGTPIYEGDIIETNAEGAVNIIFIDETEFAISEDARLAIDEYVFDPSTSEGSSSFSVLKGVFVFTSGEIGRDDPDDVEIETPVGSIGIRGTIIAGKIDPDGVENEITVVEGAIVIRNAAGETTLSNQFETVQLSGYESEIVNIGQIDSTQMNQKFGSVSGVSGSLFSAINETGTQEGNNGEPNIQEDPAAETSGEGQSAEEESMKDATQENLNEEAALDTVQSVEDNGPELLQNDVLNLETVQTGLETKFGSERTVDTAAGNKSLKPVISKSGTTSNSNSNTVENQISLGQETRSLSDPFIPKTDVINPIDTSNTSPTGFSLNNGSILATRGFSISATPDTGIGSSIAALGTDLDGDGLNDFAYTGDNGQVFIYNSTASTVTSINIATIAAGNITQNLNISAGGDFDGDGNADLIFGTPQGNLPSFVNTGQIGVIEAANSAVNNIITSDDVGILAASPGTILGQDVEVIGDFNGDGYSDYLFSFDETGSGSGGLLLNKGSDTALNTAIQTSDFDIINGAGTEFFGTSLSAAGDINNDGFDDIIVGTLDNRAYIVYGDEADFLKGSVINNPAGTISFGANVTGGSDINRDGHSDFLISSTGALHGEQVHLYDGASLNQLTRFYSSQAGWEVNNAHMINDFNGDGRDDFAISTSNGVDNKIFVIYGKDSGFETSFDLNFSAINQIDAKLGVMFGWNGVGGQIELESVGDINGDGLDDLAIGASEAEFNASSFDDGAISVVYGQFTPDVVTDNSARDGNNTVGSITATSNEQALLGSANDDIINGGGREFLSVSSGAGNDNITLNAAGATHKTINGGAGIDQLFLQGDGGTLDFSSAGPAGMTLSDVEVITMGGDGQNLVFDVADIFKLLQESDTSTLRITTNGAGNSLQLSKDGADIGASPAGFTGDLGTDAIGETGFFDLNFGGYTLLVDTNITTNFA